MKCIIYVEVFDAKIINAEAEHNASCVSIDLMYEV